MDWLWGMRKGQIEETRDERIELELGERRELKLWLSVFISARGTSAIPWGYSITPAAHLIQINEVLIEVVFVFVYLYSNLKSEAKH